MVSRFVLFAVSAIATSGLIIYLLVQRLLALPHQEVHGPGNSSNRQDQCGQAEKLLALLSGFVHVCFQLDISCFTQTLGLGENSYLV